MRRALPLLLLALAGPGCESAPAETGYEPPPPACASDAECTTANYVCREGVCVINEPNPVTVSLHVRPLAESGLRDQQFHEIALADGRRLPDLILSEPVALRGLIKVRGNPLATSIPARVSLLKRGAIAGTRQRIEADAADGAGYEMSLLPGLYDIAVFPENKRFPPFKEEAFRIKSDTVRDVVLPAQDEYLRVTGRVVGREGDATGIADMRVQAFTPQRDRLSTPAVTDLEGRFELLLPPTSAVYSVGVSPTEADPLRPSVTRDNVLVEGDLELPDIALGPEDLVPVQVEGIITGQGAATAVGGASVEFRADVGNGVFRWATVSDDDGRYSARILPGEYSLRIVPPSDLDQLAVTHLEQTVEPSADGGDPEQTARVVDLEIDQRVPLTGVVRDAQQAPQADIEIEAVLTGNGDVEGLRRRVTTRSGPDGGFSLLLDRACTT